MILDTLRAALQQQQARLAEQLEAVDLAQGAFARLQEVFGLEAAQGAQDERQTVDEPTTPVDPASPAHANGAGGATANCAVCSAPFAQRTGGGKPKLYCSARCRLKFNARRARERKAQQANGEALKPEPEPPVADWPRPLAVPLEDHGASAERLRPPTLPWEQRT